MHLCLKLCVKKKTVPNGFVCQKFVSDVKRVQACRAVDMSSDEHPGDGIGRSVLGLDAKH